ncbi:hypothetical protein [Mesorhizobium sp. M0684]|uniref:hypothetical protein n=1 Tax=Mesorhizobium sp. M0684 TaxID=2956986 RepID=UPI00333E1482
MAGIKNLLHVILFTFFAASLPGNKLSTAALVCKGARKDRIDSLLSNNDADQELSFEVGIESPRDGAVLSDQVKSVDWRAPKATRKGSITDAKLAEMRGKAVALIGRAGRNAGHGARASERRSPIIRPDAAIHCCRSCAGSCRQGS